nr:3'-5' exonuclease [Vibrio sp. 10N.286.48.B7]PMH78498.1 hypothetical protein BCU58_08980 [Vibrio sp. 10N.286.48.B7]
MEDEKLSLEELRAEALEKGWAFGKGRLRDQYRMKPKPDAKPDSYVKNPHNGSLYGIYKLTDCVEIKSRKKRTGPPSEKQVKASKLLALNSKLKSREARAGATAQKWLDEECLVLDTETTGLEHGDQIIELSILDHLGNTLFDQRFRPTCKINPGAESKHMISEDMLKNEPLFSEYVSKIREILTSKPVVIFNSGFDIGMLHSTCKAFDIDHSWISEIKQHCAMELSADAYGATNRYGSISLENAAFDAGVTWKGEAHSALADCHATLDILKNLVKQRKELEDQKKELEYKFST